MHYIQNTLIGVGIAQNSHLIPFCQLRGTDVRKENEHGRATWKSNMEKLHDNLISDLRASSEDEVIVAQEKMHA